MNDTVTSADGGVVAYETVGVGPDVVLVPGALSIAADYSRFATALADHGYRVHTIERRGRGLSCDQGADYSIRTECDDLNAVLRQTGAVYLVGHSFGGLVALETAAAATGLAAVSAYEPGVSIHGQIPSDWIEPAQHRLDAGDPAGAFITFIKAMNPASRRTPDAMLRMILPVAMGRRSWRRHTTLMATTLNEHREVARLDDSYPAYAAITADVQLMYGGSGAGTGRDVRDLLADAIPHASIHEFPDLDHFGIDQKDPEAVADTVARFFGSRPPAAPADGHHELERN
ncbi:alpha/beta hydrolase [Planctomonas sp. JC2975]|uniref:alpha/beta fold hydrolase n=1 Tax=Planctomonas sp. JC2975 TaxID=2729626 RepID=UPI0014728765|nr:alpha/beta hydrolase [Planctomonas sp. JC2975]NNC13193.1 alpha/beta hydrolase [Planctomonas sp. JC2975]